jgi:hypothetical protein
MKARLLVAMIVLGVSGLIRGPLGVEATRHEVSGKGRFTSSIYLTKFEFSARGGPSRATGSIRFVVSFDGNVAPAQEGRVTCLKVQGNRAVIGGELTAGSFAGTYFAVRFEDNGRNRRQPEDELAWNYGLEQPFSCADFDLSGDLDAQVLHRGDIAVS